MRSWEAGRGCEWLTMSYRPRGVGQLRPIVAVWLDAVLATKRTFVQLPPYPARSSNQQSAPFEFARLKNVPVIPITPPR